MIMYLVRDIDPDEIKKPPGVFDGSKLFKDLNPPVEVIVFGYVCKDPTVCAVCGMPDGILRSIPINCLSHKI